MLLPRYMMVKAVAAKAVADKHGCSQLLEMQMKLLTRTGAGCH